MTLANPRVNAEGVLCHGYMELSYLLQEALQKSAQAIASVGAEFRELFGRDYTGLLWQDRLEEAEVAIVAMGSLAMEAMVAADSLRRSGLKVGVLGLRVFRPFPKSEVAQALGCCRLVVIFDRDISYGSEGAISLEIKSALYRRRAAPVVRNFIVGLGGRDVKARERVSLSAGQVQAPRQEEDPGIAALGHGQMAEPRGAGQELS